jgi:small nuclear ribonucleoprotein (snRNP)-like protein
MPGMDRPPNRSRKRKGRPGQRTGHRPPPGRRTPPPARTGLEAKFFNDAIRSGARLVVTLADGRKVRGTVQEFDRDQVTIEEATGTVVIRKTEIRYLYEQE